jgi:thiamine kinase-like enzyme
LPPSSSEHYGDLGLAAIRRVRQKWIAVKSLVSEIGSYVDDVLVQLEEDTHEFTGRGLIASHNDICSANWLISPDETIYLVDLDVMSLDDPAHDLGSILWWYYPPELRERFLSEAGYMMNEDLRERMRVRMAIHCLSILLPREGSFDEFDAHSLIERLIDFRAVVGGKENPRGYGD